MSNIAMEKIDLFELTLGEVRNLAGHDRGLKAREHFKVEALDHVDDVVNVKVPLDFLALSPSFFQGMFSASVHFFGSARLFFEHYRFDAPVHVRSKIADYAEQIAGRRS